MCTVLLSVAQLVSGDYSLSACAWHTHVKVLWKWTHNLLCVYVCVCGYISWLWRSQYSMAPSLWQVNMTFGATMKTAILYDLVVCYCVCLCVILLPYYLRFKVRLKCVKVWIFCMWLCAFKNVGSSVLPPSVPKMSISELPLCSDHPLRTTSRFSNNQEEPHHKKHRPQLPGRSLLRPPLVIFSWNGVALDISRPNSACLCQPIADWLGGSGAYCNGGSLATFHLLWL